jgi:hypothetical protein
MYKGPHGKTPPDVEARVLALIAKRWSRNLIGRTVGIGPTTVGRIAKDAGLVVERGRSGRPMGKAKKKPKPVHMTLVREGINYAAFAAHLRW